jgi:hypothetical protein
MSKIVAQASQDDMHKVSKKHFLTDLKDFLISLFNKHF